VAFVIYRVARPHRRKASSSFTVRVGFLLLSLSSILDMKDYVFLSIAAAAAATRYYPFTGNAGWRMSILFK
jgi:hypothetical protein